MKVFYFAVWLFRKLTKSLTQTREDFKERLRYRTGEAVFVYFGISVLIYVSLMFPVIAYSDTFKELTDFSAGYWSVTGLYFVYMIFSMLYDKFVEEQEEFVNKLKR